MNHFAVLVQEDGEDDEHPAVQILHGEWFLEEQKRQDDRQNLPKRGDSHRGERSKRPHEAQDDPHAQIARQREDEGAAVFRRRIAGEILKSCPQMSGEEESHQEIGEAHEIAVENDFDVGGLVTLHHPLLHVSNDGVGDEGDAYHGYALRMEFR